MRKLILGWVLPLLIVDQILKIYTKLNFTIGEHVDLIPGLLEFQFIENEGMAFGWVLPGVYGKLLLTAFRLIACVGIGIYLNKLIERKSHRGLTLSVAMIWAGAIGNIIDSAVYGRLFSHSGWGTVAHFGMEDGYSSWFMANVVDMFHFTVTFPSWIPTITMFGHKIVLAGAEIFPPIWNVADAAITIGVIWIILKQKQFFGETAESDSDV